MINFRNLLFRTRSRAKFFRFFVAVSVYGLSGTFVRRFRSAGSCAIERITQYGKVFLQVFQNFSGKNRNLFCISKLQMCILRCVSIFSCFLSGVLFLSQLFAFTYSLLTCLIVIVIVTSLLCWIVFIVHNFRQKNTLCREYRQNMRNAHKRRARSSEFSIFWFFFWIRLFKEWIIILFF